MKNKKAQKVQLQRETLRNLTEQQVAAVAGGSFTSNGCPVLSGGPSCHQH
jgi:hypothetical protein